MNQSDIIQYVKFYYGLSDDPIKFIETEHELRLVFGINNIDQNIELDNLFYVNFDSEFCVKFEMLGTAKSIFINVLYDILQHEKFRYILYNKVNYNKKLYKELSDIKTNSFIYIICEDDENIIKDTIFYFILKNLYHFSFSIDDFEVGFGAQRINILISPKESIEELKKKYSSKRDNLIIIDTDIHRINEI